MAARRDGSASWFPHRRALATGRGRVFCFPHAGGGASTFRGWSGLLPGDVEVCAAELPGRETRFIDPLQRSVADLLPPLLDAMGPLLDRPFVLLGHSLGALLAFEIAHAVARRGGPSPRALVVCGHRAPHLPRRRAAIHAAADDELERALRDLDDARPEVWEDRELVELLLPVVRADLEIAETYRCEPRPPLSCPILAFGGTEDSEVPEIDLAAWASHTTADFRVTMLPGGHFFVREKAGEVALAAIAALGTRGS